MPVVKFALSIPRYEIKNLQSHHLWNPARCSSYFHQEASSMMESEQEIMGLCILRQIVRQLSEGF